MCLIHDLVQLPTMSALRYDEFKEAPGVDFDWCFFKGWFSQDNDTFGRPCLLMPCLLQQDTLSPTVPYYESCYNYNNKKQKLLYYLSYTHGENQVTKEL